MFGFGALNAEHTDNESSFAVFHEVRQEEQEAAALSLYNKALHLLKENELTGAKENFLAVLDTELSLQAPEALKEDEELMQNAALFLKFNVYKKLSDIAETEDENEKALDYLLEAAVIDESDVSVWWRVANLAMSTLNIRLVRYASEKGLTYSPNHALFLDQLVNVLYIIGDYMACLTMIAEAFERNESYSRGFAIRDQIFKEEPHFKKDCLHMRSLYCEDPEFDKSKYQKFIEEALITRGKRNILAKKEELSKLKLTKPLQYYSWVSIAESLLDLYEESINGETYQSLGVSVDLSKYYKTEDQQNNLAVPTPDVLSKKYKKNLTKDGEKTLKRKKPPQSSQNKDSEPQPKRRSTRVKLSKPKEIDVNWTDVVSSFLPNNLRSCSTPMETDESSQESQESTYQEEIPSQTYCGTVEEIKKESVCVSKFINENIVNSGCINLMENLLMNLSNLFEEKWPTGLATLYESLYEKFQKHVFFPNEYSNEGDTQYMAKLAKIVLLSLEFRLDYLHRDNKQQNVSVASPMKSPYKKTKALKFDETSRLMFLKDMHYVSRLGAINEMLDASLNFKIRYFWVQGRYCMIQNEIEMARNSFSNCLFLLSSNKIKEVVIHNCHYEKTIDEDSLEKKLNTAKQSQSLDELRELLNNGKYTEVIKLLEEFLDVCSSKKADIKFSPDRPSQLVILQEALLMAKQYKNFFKCSDVILSEIFISNVVIDVWKPKLVSVLAKINRCLLKQEAVQYITIETIQLFCEKLIKLIDYSMENEQESLTTLPWLLLYRMIKWEESKNEFDEQALEFVDEDENSNDSNKSDSKIPTSFEFLRNAHDYLGRKQWCCHDNGILLEEMVIEGVSMLNRLSKTEKEMVYYDIEQCLYCLYGNPCKKSKTKGIQDHNDSPITLTWQNVKMLFDFYKPDGLPQLNIRTNTVSFEVQNVFRKIVTVVPQKQVEKFSVDSLQHYIDGGEFPVTNKTTSQDKRSDLLDLFYYLGDYYFKNKEFTKALKFYMHDICINPNRFQSWAAMAFARGSRLEEKIDQCNLKSDIPIKKDIAATLRKKVLHKTLKSKIRCFEKAMELNNKKCLVLEEYGQTAYMLHAYFSRRIRELEHEEKIDTFSIESHKMMRREMLMLAEKCFTDALKLYTTTEEGEKWLHYYMLGKTAEKLKKLPHVYLVYYQQSLEELYQSGAHFLKKLPYHGPPEYSIEAIELFYRIHTSILKVLHSDSTTIVDFNYLEERLDLLYNQNIYQEMLDIDQASLKENEKDEKPIERNITIKHCTNETTDTKPSYNKEANKQDNDEIIDIISWCNKPINSLFEDVKNVMESIIDKICGPKIASNPCKKQIDLTICNDDVELERNCKTLINTVIKDACNELLMDSMMSNDTTDSIQACLHDIVERVCSAVNEKKEGERDAIKEKQKAVFFDPVFTPSIQSLFISDPVFTSSIQSTFISSQPFANNVVKNDLVSRIDNTKTTYTVKTIPSVSKENLSTECEQNQSLKCIPTVASTTTLKVANDTSETSVMTRHVPDQNIKILKLANSSILAQINSTVSSTKLFNTPVTLVSSDSNSQQILSTTTTNISSNTNVSLCDQSPKVINNIVEQNEEMEIDQPYELSKQSTSDRRCNDVGDVVATPIQSRVLVDDCSDDVNIVKDVLNEIVNIVSLWTPKSSKPTTVKRIRKMKIKRRPDTFTLTSTKPLKMSVFKKKSLKNETDELSYKKLAMKCISGLGFCLRRFPEHFKSQYTMAHFLASDTVLKNLQWSRDLLLGSSIETKYDVPLPSHGIFSGKKKTNLFQYLWRIPINEVDRPGSFCSHLSRGVELLIYVLHGIKDSALLLHLTWFLHRTPDKDKKYLRDNDRLLLSTKAFESTIDALQKRTLQEKSTSQNIDVKSQNLQEDELGAHVIELHETYKLAQKMQQTEVNRIARVMDCIFSYFWKVESFLLEAYEKLTGVNECEKSRSEIHEEITKYCQQNKSNN